ncbi:MAG: hypothetical protein LBL48_09355 [Azoarcus sp.]|jgi:hypothetical protein|nr:hypothetical protein [Azoarcus sp.]
MRNWFADVLLSFLTMLGAVWAEGASQGGTDEKIMMRYGFSFEDKSFDASRWFRNGMYQRRPDKISPSGFAEWSMIRVSPPPIKDSDLDDMRAWLTTGLNPMTHDIPELGRVPEGYEKILLDDEFDPRPETRYTVSSFKEADVPLDHYATYLLIEGKRFYVDLARDAQTGEFVGASRTDSIYGISYEEQQKLFKELAEKQRQREEMKSLLLKSRNYRVDF